MSGASLSPDPLRVRLQAKSTPSPRRKPSARVARPTGIRRRGVGAADATCVAVGVVACASAFANASALSKRSAGVRASAFAMAASTDGGTASRSSRTGRGDSVKRRATIACGVAALKGTWPVSISYSTVARL